MISLDNEVLHNFSRSPSSGRFKSLDTKMIASQLPCELLAHRVLERHLGAPLPATGVCLPAAERLAQVFLKEDDQVERSHKR